MSSIPSNTADTPYTGIPAFLTYSPSLAPVDISGTITTPGHILWASALAGSTTSGRSGEAGLNVGGRSREIWTPVSASTRLSVASTESGGWSGRILQFTVARANWGRALSAWPAKSRVATQVVRSNEL